MAIFCLQYFCSKQLVKISNNFNDCIAKDHRLGQKYLGHCHQFIKAVFLLLAHLLVLPMLFIAVNSPTVPGQGNGFNAPLPFKINLSVDFT